MHLVRSTSQEETLAVKSTFEIWAATVVFKIKRYRIENKIFPEEPIRSEIEYAKKTIKFVGLDLIIKISLLKKKHIL